MKKGVIFDLDGTLINSIPAHFHVHQKVCKRFGITLTEEFFELYCNGQKESDFYKVILKKHEGNLNRYHIILRAAHMQHLKVHFERMKVFSGVKSTLKRLKKAGMSIAVASSSPKLYILYLLRHNNIRFYFDTIVSANDVKKTKPAPDIFLKARKKLGLKKAECVVVEDAIAGVKAAKNAKIDCICLLTSERREDIPTYATVVEKHMQLVDVISKMK